MNMRDSDEYDRLVHEHQIYAERQATRSNVDELFRL